MVSISIAFNTLAVSRLYGATKRRVQVRKQLNSHSPLHIAPSEAHVGQWASMVVLWGRHFLLPAPHFLGVKCWCNRTSTIWIWHTGNVLLHSSRWGRIQISQDVVQNCKAKSAIAAALIFDSSAIFSFHIVSDRPNPYWLHVLDFPFLIN